MRKLLIAILLVLLIVMAVLSIKDGINIGSLNVLGVIEIENKNDNLTQKISQAKSTNEQYTTNLEDLKKSISRLITAKEECLNLINISTDSQLKDATQTKNYTIEYLWSAVGNHATKEGVDIKMEVTTGSISDANYRNLKFTVSGNYLAITNFITVLENDSSLEFTIDEFSMTQNQCTFVVKDVKIQQEQTSTITNPTNTNTQENNTQENTNTVQ